MCGPFDIQARGGYVYFITFIDDYSWYGFVYLMHRKSEVFEKFIEFRHEVEKLIEKSIKILRSDREEKYLSKKFLSYLRKNDIVS